MHDKQKRNKQMGRAKAKNLHGGKTLGRAGATPLRCHGKRGGRSSPQVEPGIRSRRVLLGRAARFRREQMKKVRIAHCTCGLPLSSPQDAGSCQKRSRMSDITDGTVT